VVEEKVLVHPGTVADELPRWRLAGIHRRAPTRNGGGARKIRTEGQRGQPALSTEDQQRATGERACAEVAGDGDRGSTQAADAAAGG
jgi:hypothetical protein